MSTEFNSNNSASQPGPTLRQFFDQKQPATDEDRILVIAYYLERFRGESHFDYHRIDDCFDEVDHPRSSNAATLLSCAKKKKLVRVVRERSPRTYRLTAPGKQEVEKMPRAAGSKRGAKKKPRQPSQKVQRFLQFKDETDLVDIHEAGNIEECALWVLTVAKEYLGIEELNTTEIYDILHRKYNFKHGRRTVGTVLKNSKWVIKKGRSYVIRPAGIERVQRGSNPMTLEELKRHFIAYGLDADLVQALSTHYREMKEALSTEHWEEVGIRGGKFVEAVFRLLEQFVTGSRSTRRINEVRRALENRSGSVDPSFCLTIPRVAYGAYDIRSRRGVAHLSLAIDPNQMDSMFIVSACDWILAELTRLCLGNTPSEAEQIIRRIMERPVPLVEESATTL